ncbi:hypothetical protein FM042_00805 [Aliidiomarina halalkaliphila]|uniref:Uncharacterized protein n=1 Tax=Aliidiomarina halalkaliphila TaxID=2593535 RepID=A0A552X350_9GAMM|nr:hypothetical protein [Aliidiomarina halalkaliphila]TRW49437.1 hypothetical protein FM042_00805 [Aliidiomarina halalkaliphila]
MPKLVRNIFAILVGVVLGAFVNSLIIAFGPGLIPPPDGVDMSTAEGLRDAMPLLQPQHFVMPFLAHALGTFVGVVMAYLIAASARTKIGYGIGVFFLLGGIAASVMIPAPAWFITVDLIVAYLPMAWLGIFVGRRIIDGLDNVRNASA